MREIVIAPFSNGDIRDWQPRHFSQLIGLLLERWDGMIRVVGARSQATRAAGIVRPYDSSRVVSDCGILPWHQIAIRLREAACVVGNNSGITHLSGWLGVPSLCLFGGSHRRAEWHPMGPSTQTISRAVDCAPCQLHRADQCPYGRICLSEIDPALVADAVLAAIAGTNGEGTAHGA